jgi:hypothetical protein
MSSSPYFKVFFILFLIYSFSILLIYAHGMLKKSTPNFLGGISVKNQNKQP